MRTLEGSMLDYRPVDDALYGQVSKKVCNWSRYIGKWSEDDITLDSLQREYLYIIEQGGGRVNDLLGYYHMNMQYLLDRTGGFDLVTPLLQMCREAKTKNPNQYIALVEWCKDDKFMNAFMRRWRNLGKHIDKRQHDDEFARGRMEDVLITHEDLLAYQMAYENEEAQLFIWGLICSAGGDAASRTLNKFRYSPGGPIRKKKLIEKICKATRGGFLGDVVELAFMHNLRKSGAHNDFYVEDNCVYCTSDETFVIDGSFLIGAYVTIHVLYGSLAVVMNTMAVEDRCTNLYCEGLFDMRVLPPEEEGAPSFEILQLWCFFNPEELDDCMEEVSILASSDGFILNFRERLILSESESSKEAQDWLRGVRAGDDISFKIIPVSPLMGDTGNIFHTKLGAFEQVYTAADLKTRVVSISVS